MGFANTIVVAVVMVTASSMAGAGEVARRIVVVPRNAESVAAAEEVARGLKAAGDVTVAPVGELESLPLARVRKALEEGKSLYRKLALGDAIRRLQALENEVLPALATSAADGTAPHGGARALAMISFWLAVCHSGARESEKAADRFASAALLDPTFEPDSSFSPTIVAQFKKAREGLPALARATLTVVAEPAPARLFLNGRAIGRAPQTLELPEGVHVIGAALTGFRPLAMKVHAQPNRIDNQRLFLAPEEGTALAASVARAVRAGSSDLQETATLSALASRLDANAVVSVGAAGGKLSYAVVVEGKSFAKAIASGATEAVAAVLSVFPGVPRVVPAVSKGAWGRPGRVSLSFSAGFLYFFDSFAEGVGLPSIEARATYWGKHWLTLFLSVGVARAQSAAVTILDGGEKQAAILEGGWLLPFQLGVGFGGGAGDVVRFRFEVGPELGIALPYGPTYALGYSSLNPEPSPSFFLGLQTGTTVDFVVSRAWSLRITIAYHLAHVFFPGDLRIMKGTSLASVDYASNSRIIQGLSFHAGMTADL